MQHWYYMSDSAMEDALYEIYSMRKIAGLSLERIPDEATILNFRQLLEKHKRGEKIFREISNLLEEYGLILKKEQPLIPPLSLRPVLPRTQKVSSDPTKKGISGA